MATWAKTARAVWYGFLIYVPLAIGFHNAKMDGEFLPGFFGGMLVIALPLFGIGELLFFVLRRRRKILNRR